MRCVSCDVQEAAYLGQESVHKHVFVLSEAVRSVDALNVVGRIPRGVEDDHPVGRHQVDAQRSGSRGDEKQPAAEDRHEPSTQSLGGFKAAVTRAVPVVGRVVELIGPLLSQGGAGAAVQTIVVDVSDPAALWEQDRRVTSTYAISFSDSF